MDKKELTDSIIYKFLAGSANFDESRNFTEWLNESRENRMHYLAIKRIWIENKDIPDKEKIIEDSLSRLKLRTTFPIIKETRGTNLFGVSINKIFIAATIVALIGTSFFFGLKLKSVSEYNQTSHEITVPLGARTNITLPDGSNVWLNAGSTLNYRSDFGYRNRDIFLTGEAYFDVSPDNSSVFTVYTRDLNIRALGTQFNVKNYPEETVTEAIIVEGEIEVLVTGEGIRSRPVFLSSNQRITYSRDARQVLVDEQKYLDDEEMIVAAEPELEPELKAKPRLIVSNVIDSDKYTSWKDGRLTFRGESLATLVPKLERFYNVKISFEDESLKDFKYTGVLEEVTVEEVLRAISRASGISYKIDKNIIILTN